MVEPETTFRLSGIGDFPTGLTRYDALQDTTSVFRVEEPDGAYWICVDRELSVAALQDSATFSSSSASPFDSEMPFALPPVMLDPPDHSNWRRLLLPWFTAKRIQTLEERVRERTQELLDKIEPRGECDFVKEFAFQLPTVIFLELLGLPVEDLDLFLSWLSPVVHPSEEGTLDRDGAAEAMGQIAVRCSELLADRRAHPDPSRDDIASSMVTWEIDGVPVPDDQLMLCCVLLFIAGLDTVANAMAYAVRYLATHDGDRQMITSGSLAMAPVAEELLRAFTIPEITRKVMKDVELGDQLLHAGDLVLFPIGPINRDPKYVDHAREVVLDRQDPPVNYAFGTGAHRCIGIHLARLEMRTFLEMWHARIPDYRLADSSPVREYWGPVHGMKSLPLRWG